MKQMKQWTLGRKAFAVCLLLGMLDVLQGAISLVNFYRTQSTVNALNADSFAALYWAGKLKGAAKDQRIRHHPLYQREQQCGSKVVCLSGGEGRE